MSFFRHIATPDNCNEMFLHRFICFLLDNKYAGPSKALPRCALPKYLIEELQKHIPNAIFVSNPCRFDMKLMLKIPTDIRIILIGSCTH